MKRLKKDSILKVLSWGVKGGEKHQKQQIHFLSLSLLHTLQSIHAQRNQFFLLLKFYLWTFPTTVSTAPWQIDLLYVEVVAVCP